VTAPAPGASLLGISQRQPPANLHAEQALLGALLANNKAYERVSDFLRPDHFADAIHSRIYDAIQRRCDAGQVADVVTLRAEFENAGVLDDVGGVTYLVDLLSAMVGIINAGEYGQVVHDAWLRRQLIDLGEVVVNRAFGHAADIHARDVLEEAEALLFALSETSRGKAGGDTASAADVAAQVEQAHERAMNAAGGLVGLSSGYRALDRVKGGFLPGELILIGARPGMGKSALAAGLACNAARTGARVLFTSAEMEAWEMQARMVAAQARLPLQAVLRAWVLDPGSNRGRPLAQHEVDAFYVANRAIAELPITWDVRARPTVASIRTRARRMKARGGLDLVVVDYLQLLSAGGNARGGANRNEELSSISADLKGLAMELRVPVVALSQLSRNVESRDDKRPQLSDLRDSGSLEQDANVVMFLYREHYYLKDKVPERRERETEEAFSDRLDGWRERLTHSAGLAEVNIAKHRQGATGIVQLRWDERLTWFFDREDAPRGAEGGDHG
jgi:replicative DNA helicase